MYFRCFVIFSPWKRAWPFIWKKTSIPFTKRCFYQVWLKLAQRFWRKFFCFNFVHLFSLFCYLPWEKGTVLHFNQRSFVLSFVEIGPLNLEKKMKMWKFYRQMDNGWQAIRKAHLSSQLRWAKKVKFIVIKNPH